MPAFSLMPIRRCFFLPSPSPWTRHYSRRGGRLARPRASSPRNLASRGVGRQRTERPRLARLVPRGSKFLSVFAHRYGRDGMAAPAPKGRKVDSRACSTAKSSPSTTPSRSVRQTLAGRRSWGSEYATRPPTRRSRASLGSNFSNETAVPSFRPDPPPLPASQDIRDRQGAERGGAVSRVVVLPPRGGEGRA